MPRLPPWQKRLPDTKPGPLNGAALCMRMPQRRARTPPRSVTTDGVRNGLPEPPWATSQEAAERSSRPAAPVRSVATHLVQPCPGAAAWATSRMRLAPTKTQRATAQSSRERTSLLQRVRQQDHPQPRARDVDDQDAAGRRPIAGLLRQSYAGSKATGAPVASSPTLLPSADRENGFVIFQCRIVGGASKAAELAKATCSRARMSSH
jgi:hypothetical protein